MKNGKTNGRPGAKTPGKSVGAAPKPTAKAAAPKKAAAKPDPRTVPAPIAPARVAEKAVAAIAAVPAVAEAAPKKSEAVKAAAPKLVATTTSKAAPAVAPAPKLEALAPKPAMPAPTPEGILPSNGIAASAATAIAPLATALEVGADQARAAYVRVQDTGDSLRQAVARSTSATTRGLAEINGKMLDLIRAQNDATIDLWRSTLTAPSLSEAVRAQTSGLRQAYEATAAQWKDIAETAGRVLGEAAKPLQSALAQAR